MLSKLNLPKDFSTLLNQLIEIPNLLRESSSKFLDESENVNIHGEKSMQLDMYANDLVKESLLSLDFIHSIASEEEDEIINVNPNGKYLVCFDPLDGSSLISSNQAVGMVFAIYDKDKVFNSKLSDSILMSVYFHIGKNNSLVVNYDNTVYNLEYLFDEFHFKEVNTIDEMARNIAPGNLKILSSNDKYKNYLLSRLDNGLKLRYFACLISDVHFILSKASGIFIYLNDQNHPNGKLRLLYEVAPVSHILTALNAKSINHKGQSILDLVPEDVHENSTLVIGSSSEVDLFKELVLNVIK